MTKPRRPDELPSEVVSHKRMHDSVHEIIVDAKIYRVSEVTLIESTKPNPYPNCVALMCNLVDKEPTCFEETTK